MTKEITSSNTSDFRKTEFLRGKGFDYEKFNQLSESREVKSSLNKIMEVCGKEAFKKEWAELEKQDLSKTYEALMKQYPGIVLWISQLGLDLGKQKFSQLSNEQKITYTALYKTFMLGK